MGIISLQATLPMDFPLFKKILFINYRKRENELGGGTGERERQTPYEPGAQCGG